MTKLRRATLIISIILFLPLAWGQTAGSGTLAEDTASDATNAQTTDSGAQALSPDETISDDAPVMEGEGITVVREPPRAAQSKTITQKQIGELRPHDLTDLISRAFGLGTLRYGGYGNDSSINMRGFGTGRVAILVDGVPVNSAQSGDFDLNSIDVASIEKVEVVYGGADSRYNVSGGSGGTINIVTVGKPMDGIRVTAGVSNVSNLGSEAEDLADGQKVDLGFGIGDGKRALSLDFFANRAGNHFAYRNDAGDDRRRTGNEVYDAGGGAKLEFLLPSQSTLAIAARAYAADKDIPGVVGSSNPGTQKDARLSESAQLSLNRVGTDRLTAEFSLTHEFKRLDWEDLSSSSRHDLDVENAVTRWGLYLNDGIQLAWGGDARRSDLDSTNTGKVGRTDGGVTASADISVTRFLTVTPSCRLAVSDTETMPVPKLGFLWSLPSGATLKNNFYRVYKLPNFNDLYWSGDSTAEGNPNLKSEDGLGTDTAFAWKKPGAYAAEVSGYFSWHRNSIHWSSESGILRPENCREALIAGSDARISSDFSKAFTVALDYSFLRTWVKTDLFDYSDGKSIPYQPTHRFSIDFRANADDTLLYLTPRYESARYTAIENVTELDPYFTLDAGASRKIGKAFEAYLDAKNVFSESYELVDGYPMPGATITVGARMDVRSKKSGAR